MLRAVARAWSADLAGLRGEGDPDRSEYEGREDDEIRDCERVRNPLRQDPRCRAPTVSRTRVGGDGYLPNGALPRRAPTVP